MGIDPLNSNDPEEAIRVGIGLIEREGSYLIRQRRPGQAMAGYWEFPGGKAEAGETAPETTFRECFEEVGLKVLVGEMVHHVVHRYDHGLVELYYFRCRIEGLSTEPSADSGFEWVAAVDLLRYRFPEANDKVIEILALKAAGARGSLRGES
jgi:8-oxo-dGTP diphosphatase